MHAARADERRNRVRLRDPAMRAAPQAPARHARPGDFATNAVTPATCRIDAVSGRAAFSCTRTPMSHGNLWVGNGTHPWTIKSRPRRSGSNARPSDRRSSPGGRRDLSRFFISTIRWRQLWKPAQFLDRRLVHAEDGLLDVRDLAPGRGGGSGRADGTGDRIPIGPVPEERPRPVKRPSGACHSNDLDRPAVGYLARAGACTLRVRQWYTSSKEEHDEHVDERLRPLAQRCSTLTSRPFRSSR